MRGTPSHSPAAKPRGTSRRSRLPLLLCLLVLLTPVPGAAASAPSAGKAPSIEQVVVTNDRSSLLLFCRLGNLIPPDALQNTKALAPLQIRYAIRVHRDRNMWPDQLVAEMNLVQELTFDPVKESYQLKTSSPVAEEVLRANRIEEILPLLGAVNALQILPLGRLKARARYYLTIKATLSSARDIFWRNHIFFFDRNSLFETPWHRTGIFGISGSVVR